MPSESATAPSPSLSSTLHPSLTQPSTPQPLTRNVDWRRGDRLIIAAITGLALLLRLYRLDYRSLWIDEFYTMDALLRTLPDMIENRLYSGHMPTYFILMKLWTGVAGISDWTMRFPSAVFGTLLVPAAAYLARPFAPRLFVFGLAGAACLSGAAIWAGQEARMYALLAVTATLCHGFYLRTLASPRSAGTWAGYYTALLVSISLQPVMLLWYAAHLVFSFVERKRHPVHARFALRVAAVLTVALIPALLYFGTAQNKFADLQISLPSLRMLLWRFPPILFGAGNDITAVDYVARAATITALIAGIVIWRRDRAGRRQLDTGTAPPLVIERPLLTFSFIVVIVPAALLWLGECFLPNVLGPWRYQLPSFVLLWVLFLWVIGEIRTPSLRKAAIIATALLLVAGAVAHWTEKGTGLREAGMYVAGKAEPGDLVAHATSPALTLGLRHYGIPKNIETTEVPFMSHENELPGYLGNLQQRDRVWLVIHHKRRRECELLLKHFSRTELLTPIPEQTFNYRQCKVLAYRPVK